MANPDLALEKAGRHLQVYFGDSGPHPHLYIRAIYSCDFISNIHGGQSPAQATKKFVWSQSGVHDTVNSSPAPGAASSSIVSNISIHFLDPRWLTGLQPLTVQGSKAKIQRQTSKSLDKSAEMWPPLGRFWVGPSLGSTRKEAREQTTSSSKLMPKTWKNTKCASIRQKHWLSNM